jgi:hypothetical protein
VERAIEENNTMIQASRGIVLIYGEGSKRSGGRRDIENIKSYILLSNRNIIISQPFATSMEERNLS